MNQQPPQNNREAPLPTWLNKIRALVQNKQNSQGAQQPVPQPGAMSQRTSWAAPPVKFTEAVKICLLHKFSDFSGRASRSEFWLFAAVYFLILFIPFIGVIVGLLLTIPLAAAGARRLHDNGKSGRWLLSIPLLFIYIPIYLSLFGRIDAELLITILLGIILMCCYPFFYLVQEGEDKRNRFDNDVPSQPHP